MANRAKQMLSMMPELSELDTQPNVVGLGGHGLCGSPAGELAESSACRIRAARGALLGILLGAAIYGGMLLLVGIIER